jgi:hypothetical protein
MLTKWIRVFAVAMWMGAGLTACGNSADESSGTLNSDSNPNTPMLSTVSAKSLHSEALPSIVGNWPNITFGGGVPVGGWASFSVFPSGAYNFVGHFHNSGAVCFDVNMAFVLRSSDGTAIPFGRSGSMGGTFCGGSRDYDWSESGTNATISADWSALEKGWNWRAGANAGLNVPHTVDQIVQQLSDTVGPVVKIISIL